MRCSIDLRERVIKFVQAGGSKTEAAKRFVVGVRSVRRWTNDPRTPQKPGPTAPRMNMLKLATAATSRPDAMLDELAADFGVHPSTIWRRLRALGLTQKKRGGTLR
jgi:transposase